MRESLWLLAVAVLIATLTAVSSGCGTRAWISQRIYSPKQEGVVAHTSRHGSRAAAMREIREYCVPLNYKLVTEWDGSQDEGRYQVSIADGHVVTVSLDTG
mgnify:CR=1 FL=1